MLTPSTTLSACSGDEVVVKCYEPETTANTRISLRWVITPQNKIFPTIELSLSDIDNQSQRLEAGLQFNFYAGLTSYTPLISTFMTVAYPALNGATVMCLTPSTMGILTIIVHEQTGNQFIYFTSSYIIWCLYTHWSEQPEICSLNITGGTFKAEHLTVIIEWEGNSDCLDFTVSLTPSSNGSSLDYSITTNLKNKSHTLNILYNTNYTVTVTISGGNNSSGMSRSFSFSKCSIKFNYHNNKTHFHAPSQSNVNHHPNEGILSLTDMILQCLRMPVSFTLARLVIAFLTGKILISQAHAPVKHCGRQIFHS